MPMRMGASLICHEPIMPENKHPRWWRCHAKSGDVTRKVEMSRENWTGDPIMQPKVDRARAKVRAKARVRG